MKKLLLKNLIVEIATVLEDFGDADSDIKKAKKKVGDKLKSGKALTQPEAEIAVSDAGQEARKDMSNDLNSSTSSIKEDEEPDMNLTSLTLSNGEKVKVNGHPRAWIRTLRLGAVKAMNLSDRIKAYLKDNSKEMSSEQLEKSKKEASDLVVRAKARLNKAIEINSKYKLGYGGGKIAPLK